jgi:hypothetical protein
LLLNHKLNFEGAPFGVRIGRPACCNAETLGRFNFRVSRVLELFIAMDSSQRCQEQAAECVRLMKSAPTRDQARLLENISMSWSRLAGQIDRYNALVRDQGRMAARK